MPAPLFSIVEGWTGPLPFTLQTDGTPLDLTGLTVKLVLKSADGTLVYNHTTSGITVTGTTAGQLEWAPTTSDFVSAQTPYRIRFSVTDAVSDTVYFPNDEEDLIEVNPV